MQTSIGRFASAIRRQRTSWEPPTALGLLLVLALLLASLAVPQRSESRVAWAAEVSVPQLNPAAPGKPITLRDRLVTGLRARLDSEVDFVDAVVDEVQAGRLPQRLVDQTFFWARNSAARRQQSGRNPRPIIYFQRAMTLQARRVGVNL